MPLMLVGALTSAIWTGETRVPAFLSEESSDRVAPDFDADLADSLLADDKADDNQAISQKPGIQIGWRSHPDSRVAVRSYYFGPLADDLIASFRAVWLIYKGIRRLRRNGLEWGDQFEAAMPRIIIPVSIYAGLPIGVVVGFAVIAVVEIAYLIVGIISVVTALCLMVVLRAIDNGICFAAGIARICLGCGANVHLCPHYLCPGCGKRHNDIRPGPYGVIRRTCICGRKMPTMLLTGADALQGMCPQQDCNAYLPPMFGKVAELVIPFFGAVNAGKTQLMYMLATGLLEWVHDQHGNVTYIGDAHERLNMISDALGATGHPDKTLVGRPRGLGLYVSFGLTKRLVYFFDAAGEMYTLSQRLSELRYLDKARAYVFVADPLSANAVWSQLAVGQQENLDRFRAPHGDVDKSFQATVNYMLKKAQRKRFRRRRSQLAFVVSKLDMLQSAGVDVTPIIGSTEQWVASEGGLSLGNLTRRSAHSFDAVQYFCTAALEDEGRVDYSVGQLLQWILECNGIRMGG